MKKNWQTIVKVMIGVACAAAITAKANTSFTIFGGFGNSDSPVHYLHTASNSLAFVDGVNTFTLLDETASHTDRRWYFSYNGNWAWASLTTLDFDGFDTYAANVSLPSFTVVEYFAEN